MRPLPCHPDNYQASPSSLVAHWLQVQNAEPGNAPAQPPPPPPPGYQQYYQAYPPGYPPFPPPPEPAAASGGVPAFVWVGVGVLLAVAWGKLSSLFSFFRGGPSGGGGGAQEKMMGWVRACRSAHPAVL